MLKDIEEIRRRCLFRLKDRRRYGMRLTEELDWISENGCARTFLLAADLISQLRRQGYRAVLTGTAEYSLVCYGLSLTVADPVEWGLPFYLFTDIFEDVHAFSVDVSTVEDGIFPPKSYTPPEDVVFLMQDRYMTPVATFLNGDAPDCIFAACESRNGDLLKALMALPGAARKMRFNAGILKEILENGFDGFDCLPKDTDSPLLKGVRPECFSDLCLVYALRFPQMGTAARNIFAVRDGAEVQATGDRDADRLLMESYGVPVWEEQRSELCRLRDGIADEAVRNRIADLIASAPRELPSKAAAIRIVQESIQCTALRLAFPKEYADEYGKIEARMRKDIEDFRRNFKK